jgi:acyl-CoA synthetase (AMP-forming)/AMP-acid ligase II
MSAPTSRLDRAALRALAREARPAAVESYLVTEAAEILALRPAQLDPRRPVSAYGLDSLKAVELRFRVEEELGVSLPIESLASEVTFTGLAEQLLAELHLDDDAAPAQLPPPPAPAPVPGHELPPGTLGEIWVSGPGVSPGYWDNPEATAAAFGARLSGGCEAPFLRTGDLGFFSGGELLLAARLKDLLKLRGRAYFPSELEATVEACHPALRAGGAAALALDDGDAARLVLVVELTREISADPASLDGPAVLLAIQAAMAADHQIGFDAVALVRAGSVPKTSSGKLQRYLCRDAFVEGTLDALYCHPAAG